VVDQLHHDSTEHCCKDDRNRALKTEIEVDPRTVRLPRSLAGQDGLHCVAQTGDDGEEEEATSC